MATKRPQPFFPEGCPQAGPGEAGVIAALGGDSVPQTFMAAQLHAEGSNATRPAPRGPSADRQFRKVVPQVSGTKPAADLPLEDVTK